MNKKKLLPLVLLVALAAVLGFALALLNSSNAAEAETGVPLLDFTAEEITSLSYAGDNTEATLLKSSAGDWMLDSDPTLPLDQSAVQSLVEKYAALRAARKLSDSERGEIPDATAAPQMIFTVTAGESTRTLTVDNLNAAADIYYVYADDGTVYTLEKSAVSGLCKTPQSLYAAQAVTDSAADDAVQLQTAGMTFVKNGDDWTLADDADYPLQQSVINKMVRTLCEMQAAWSITAPQADAAYGLDTPDAEAVVTFADGSTLTVQFGSAVTDDDSLCYLRADTAPDVIYEVNADYKAAFAVTKESLHDETATAETAAADTVVAEHPIGGKDDYAG